MADSYILLNDGVYDSIATDATACVIKSDWNAAVCKGDIGRLTFNAPGGPRIGGAAPGGGAGPGAAPGAGANAPRPITVTPGAGAQPPVLLSRNGRDYTVTATNVRAGTEMKVATERPSLFLNLTEMDKDSWVIFQVPGYNNATTGAQQASLDALRKSSETAWFKDKDALWVKVVSNGDGARGPIGGGPGAGTSVQVSR
jgi:hypothetical protein